MAADSASSEPMNVLAASFTFCDEEGCQFAESTHLLVSKSYVPLKTGNAIAISYTWGEFDRHEMLLGHDDAGCKVSMVLGCEWNRSDVVEKLLHMAYNLTPTEAAMPFWIDQLCIPQDNDAVIRATLAAIPDIFNIFDAVALLPGSPCKCLREGIEQYGQHRLSNPSQEELDQLSIEWAQKMGMCVNSTSFCSYFERVWTRQEMEYTRKMHVEWTGSEMSRCVFPSAREGDIMFNLLSLHDSDEEEDADEDLGQAEERAIEAERNLAPFARQVYQNALSTEITHTHALARVKMKHDKAWHNSVLAFEDFLSRGTARVHGRYFSIEALCQFLVGVPLEFINRENQGVVLSDAEKLRKFASRLSGVGWVQRRATRQRDYVLAVWIDCPKYTVPEDFSTMSCSLLLEDAILQMERNFNVTVPALAFAGLFGCPRPSVFWRPTWYLPRLDVSDTRYVYGSVIPDCALLPIAESPGVPLNVYRPGKGRARDQILFSDFVRGKTAEQILHSVRYAVMRWPSFTAERIQSWQKTEFTDPLEGVRAGIKAMLLMAHPVLNQTFSETVQHFKSIEAMSFHAGILMIQRDIEQFQDILFELVCEALGLFLPANPFRQSLPLVFHAGEDPAIGICRQEWPGQKTSISREESAGDHVTVCRDDFALGSGVTVLEAVKVDSEGEIFPTYTGVGIWVPQTVTPWQDIGGVTVERMQNALLI